MIEIEDLKPTDRIIRNECCKNERVLFSNPWLETGVSLLTAIN